MPSSKLARLRTVYVELRGTKIFVFWAEYKHDPSSFQGAQQQEKF